MNNLVAYWPLDGSLRDARSHFHGEARGGAIEFSSLGRDGGFGRGVELSGLESIEIVGGNERAFEHSVASMTVSLWFRVDGPLPLRTLISKGVHEAWRIRGGENQGIVFEYGTETIP